MERSADNSSTTHSEVLRHKLSFAEGRLTASSDRFWNHPDLAELYPDFLIQLYHIVCGGLDLMSFAAGCSTARLNDPVAVISGEYLVHHIEEEKDHAAWLLSDIASLGIDEAAVLGSPPSSSVVSLLGRQHLRIANAHPVSVFGYLMVLEGSPPVIEQLDRIQRRTGLPTKAFRCLRSHAEDDPAHLADLSRTLDRMPLTSEQSQCLALSAFYTIDGAASLLDELLALSGNRSAFLMSQSGRACL